MTFDTTYFLLCIFAQMTATDPAECCKKLQTMSENDENENTIDINLQRLASVGLKIGERKPQGTNETGKHSEGHRPYNN